MAKLYPEDCPDIEKHTANPTGYIAWHDWAKKMGETHRVIQCPTCKFWVIWVPKKGFLNKNAKLS